MKLIRIKIVNFGQFSNFTLDLPSADLNVFFGANEAGKSTVVAFIKQVLFGFHLAKHTSDFFEDYKPLARVSPMGGSLFFENDAGERYELERLYASGRGSKVGTLTVKCDNQVVPEHVFFDQVKNIDGAFYADSFIFNQDMLAKVSAIGQSGLLERIYYLGASNSDKLIGLRDDFAKQAGDLFKKGGSKPPLNRLLSQLREEKDAVSEAEGEFATYQSLSNEYEKQKRLQTEHEQRLLDLQKQSDRLQRLQQLLPNYRELTDLEAQVEPVSFDLAQYQSARDLAATIKNLEENKQGMQKRLREIGQVQSEDAAAGELLKQKSQLLQWQNDYRGCTEKDQQHIDDQQQLLALNPELNKIVTMDQAAILDLQKDYRELPLEPADEDQTSSGMKPNYLLFVGGGLCIIGLIILASMSVIIGGMLLLAGTGCLAAAQNQQKREKQRVAQRRAQSAAARQKRAAFASKYSLALDHLDVHSLVNEWRQFQLQEKTLEANHRHEEDVLEQLNNLAGRVSRVLDRKVAADFDSVLAAFDQLEEQFARTRSRLAEKASLQMSLKQNAAKTTEANLQLQAALARAQVKDMAGYKDLQAKKHRQDELKTKIAFLRTSLEKDLPELTRLAQSQDQAKSSLAELAPQIAAQQETVRHLQSKTAEVKVKMANLANSTAVFNAKQTLANTATRFKNLSAEYLADLLAAQWIGRALDLASNERFPKMLVAAREYLQLLTNNRYNDIEIDKKLTVTRFDGKKIKVQYLSRGTSEQLYFALKLAFVQQVKDQINLPILIDDSFVNFDDKRIEQIKLLLTQVAQNNQVLIFTAQAGLVDRLGLRPLTFTKGTQNV